MLNKRKEWFLVGFILLVTFVCFSPSLKSDFVNWDDTDNIITNPNVAHLTVQNISHMFTGTVAGSYTPLTTLTFAVETSIFGMKPGAFHLDNILLHLLCTLLVYLFIRRIGASIFIAFTAAILFGIHPMRVESVSWITERKDVLYGLFFLMSLILYVSFHKTRKPVYYFLALLAFVFSLLAKIQAVTLPLVLILIDYFFEGEFRPKQLVNKIPFFLLSLATGVTGMLLLSHHGSLEANAVVPFFQRIFIGTYTLCVYIIKSYWPYELSAIYPNPENITLIFYASVLMVGGVAYLVYKYARKTKEVVFGSLFFLFNVMFMLQIVGAGQAFLADRFTYLAYIGLFFILGWALEYLYKSKWKAYLIIAGAIYLAALGAVTWSRTQVWKNSETLFSDVIKKYPSYGKAYTNLGYFYSDQDQFEKAIAVYSKAIEMNPAGYVNYSNRSEALFHQGKTEKALDDLNMALKIKPDYSTGLSNRGAYWGSLKKFDLALADLDKAIAADPTTLKALSNRSLAYYSIGNYEKASQDATAYLKLNPDEPNILNQRGLCFDHLNRNQEAVNDFNKAILLKPGIGAYFQNRSYVLAKLSDFKGALRDILKAQELGIKVNSAYLNMLQSR